MHVYLGDKKHFRARAEYAFLFISSSDYGNDFAISRADYPNFLTHDSYISCGNLVFYSHQELLDAKVEKVGIISPEHLVALRNRLIDHDNMVRWQIDVACNALAGAL